MNALEMGGESWPSGKNKPCFRKREVVALREGNMKNLRPRLARIKIGKVPTKSQIEDTNGGRARGGERSVSSRGCCLNSATIFSVDMSSILTKCALMKMR